MGFRSAVGLLVAGAGGRRRSASAPIVVSVVMAAAALSLAPAALAHYSPKKAIWGPVTVNGRSQFPMYRDLGVGIFEMQLNWAAVAPTRPRSAQNPNDPAYQWPSDIAYAIGQAARYHIRILLQVLGAPAWANGGNAWNYPPLHTSDYARFVTAAARRYPSVHLWMIWGEPSRRPEFGIVRPASATATRLTPAQARAPHVYAQILDASYGALKAISKRNLVIGGNTYTTGDISTRDWIQYLRLPNGRPPRMDLYGHNPFSWRAPNLSNAPSPDDEVDFSDLGRLSQLVNRELAPPHHRIELFLSEWTIPTSPNDTEFGFYVDPSLQAQWIQDAWRIVNSSPFIYALGWIHVYDGDGSSGGLLTVQGVPKPGYAAFKAG
jgi:hypothetical protein